MDAAASLARLKAVRRLAEPGRHSAVLEQLRGLPVQELGGSPTLALQFGIAQGRVGQRTEAQHWVGLALDKARSRGDRVVETRALEVAGAMALEAGDVSKAVACFRHALASAEHEGDRATVGRCANNLGMIAARQGDLGRAVGWYTTALAAFQQAGLRTGLAETLHHLALAYRDQARIPEALEIAERAMHEAAAAGDLALAARTLAGRAETWLAAGDAVLAQREIELALLRHRELGQLLDEAEDLRILAAVFTALDQPGPAETMLHAVIDRAERHRRPLLQAQAERDLARLLLRLGRNIEAAQLARRARRRFEELGAELQARRLDGLLGDARS